MTSNPDPHFDVIVVGGSYAGMSAALQLVRARRRVLVLDAGVPRNRRASHMHGLIGHDGHSPQELLRQAREQLLAYPTLAWEQATAASARQQEGRFHVGLEDGRQYVARRLVLAYGVRDHLPDIAGVEARWGRTIFHCPYCHGYELQGGRIGVLGCAQEIGCHQALLMSEWGQVTLFCHGQHAQPDAEWERRLAARGVVIESSPVVGVTDAATLDLQDGRRSVQDALFLTPDTEAASPLAEQLGCGFEDGGCITTDSAKQTTVEGVFACGDVARMSGNVSLAIGEGALAGVAVHQSLVGLLDD